MVIHVVFFAPVLCEDYAETMRKRGERREERGERREERGGRRGRMASDTDRC